MSKVKPEPRMSAKEAGIARFRDRVGHPRLGLRVLAADVDVAQVGTGRERRDRHRLDDRERVALEQHPVLERARLRLVGVADEVVRLRRLGGDRGPLPPGREGGAAAPDQPGRRDLGDDGIRADLRSRG